MPLHALDADEDGDIDILTSAFVPASRAFMPARRIGRLAAFDLADTAEIAPAAADAGADAAARIAALEAQLAALRGLGAQVAVPATEAAAVVAARVASALGLDPDDYAELTTLVHAPQCRRATRSPRAHPTCFNRRRPRA